MDCRRASSPAPLISSTVLPFLIIRNVGIDWTEYFWAASLSARGKRNKNAAEPCYDLVLLCSDRKHSHTNFDRFQGVEISQALGQARRLQ